MLNRIPEKILLILLIMVGYRDVMAQERFLQRSSHGIAFTFGLIDHKYVGSVDTVESFEYEGIGIGLTYIGNQLRASVLYARPGGSGSFIDYSAKGWIMPSRIKRERQKTTIGIPIGLLVSGRRFSADNNPAPFNAQAILFGAGGAFQHAFSHQTRIQMLLMPLAGITGSRDADALGFSWAADSEALFTVENAFSNLGFSISYSVRYQFWNVNGSRVFTEIIDELYDYAGTVHTLSVGLQL
ncbi:MAG: hypothetical protein OXF08_09880 [Bacteroidetes bacterium]|nr:hypothetical protein [Bacteroidota bacterium]